MLCRPKPFKLGDTVKVRHCEGGYPLPAGLSPGVTVKVVGKADHGYVPVEHEGVTYQIHTACVDNGLQIQAGRRWLDEDHPLVAAMVRGQERRKRSNAR